MSFVYRNKFTAMKYAGGSWLLMIICLAAYFWPHAGTESAATHVRRLAFGFVGAPACLLMFVWFVREWRSGPSVLRVDESGVQVRQEPIIPWDEIESVRTLTRAGKEYLGVYAHDVERLTNRFPGEAGERFRSVHEEMGPVTVVPEETLPLPAAEILSEIEGLCRSKISPR